MINMTDSWVVVLDSPSTFTGDSLITEEDIRRKLGRLNKNKSAGPDDIHQVIVNPSARIIASSVCNMS